MNDRSLYVGNFPYATSDDDLARVFMPYGEVVRVVIITDHGTGQSKGYGFVELESAEAAIRAKEEMDGKEFNGRPLRVNDATPRQGRPQQQNNNGSSQHHASNHGSSDAQPWEASRSSVDRPSPYEREVEELPAIGEVVSRGYRNSFYPELMAEADAAS